MPGECDHCKRLFDDVEKHLEHISELSKEQVRALERHDLPWVDRMDQELEHAMGAKERSLGALKEHWRDHEH